MPEQDTDASSAGACAGVHPGQEPAQQEPTPEPSALVKERRLAWQLELELQAEKKVSSEMRLENAELQGDLRKANDEVKGLNQKMEVLLEEARINLELKEAGFEKEIKKVQAKVREVKHEWKEDDKEWKVCPCPHPSTPSVLTIYSMSRSLMSCAGPLR